MATMYNRTFVYIVYKAYAILNLQAVAVCSQTPAGSGTLGCEVSKM